MFLNDACHFQQYSVCVCVCVSVCVRLASICSSHIFCIMYPYILLPDIQRYQSHPEIGDSIIWPINIHRLHITLYSAYSDQFKCSVALCSMNTAPLRAA